MSISEKFNEFAVQKYSQQAQSFLNAYWDEINHEAEKFWTWVEQFSELDLENKTEGCNLDEFNAHRFLEKNQETKTVKELREQLKEIDLNFDKRIALIEYLLFRYKKSVNDFISRPQGDNSKEIEKAQQMIDEVQEALDRAISSAKEAKSRAMEASRTAKEAERTAQEASSRQAEATRTSTEATEKANEATSKANDALQAENEQREALAEVQAQEDSRNNRTADLTQKSEDESLGLVARNRAKNELAQHLSEDSLPLRRAKITLEAATKKATKSRLVADAAKDLAVQAKQEADNAKAKADQAKNEADRAKAEADHAKVEADNAAVAAEQAVQETEQKLQEAQDYLEEVKSKSGNGLGSVWWLERQLEEKKKYMPKNKGGNW